MGDRYLITQSLISAHDYMFDCYDSVRDKAEEDFMRVLRREPGEQSQAMLDGIAFEALCYDIADGKFRPEWKDSIEYGPNDGENHWVYPAGYNGAAQIAEIIRGAQYQVSGKKELTLDGITFLVYGKLDALKAGTIWDIKHKSKSLSQYDLAGSYFHSPQHPAYMYIVPDAYQFVYLVSDGESLYTETYLRDDVRPFDEVMADFMKSMKGMGLWKLYLEKWKSKY